MNDQSKHADKGSLGTAGPGQSLDPPSTATNGYCFDCEALCHLVGGIACDACDSRNSRRLPEAEISRLSAQMRDFDFIAHLRRQREWSERTFGPGARTKGVVDHIRKELLEIEANPSDASEWADVVILGLDGFWRAGYTPQQIIAAIEAKQAKNERRTWPDWRTADPDRAIEHVRHDVDGGTHK